MASSSRLTYNTRSTTIPPYDDEDYDDEDYDSSPSRQQTPTIHPYPIFHTTDPALRSAYSFGDPLGGTYPEPPVPDSPPPSFPALEPTYGGDEEEASESSIDDEDAEDHLSDPMILDNKLLETRRDPDYRSSQESGGSNTESESESESEGSREEIELVSEEGRGRGRGRSRGRQSRI